MNRKLDTQVHFLRLLILVGLAASGLSSEGCNIATTDALLGSIPDAHSGTPMQSISDKEGGREAKKLGGASSTELSWLTDHSFWHILETCPRCRMIRNHDQDRGEIRSRRSVRTQLEVDASVLESSPSSPVIKSDNLRVNRNLME